MRARFSSKAIFFSHRTDTAHSRIQLSPLAVRAQAVRCCQVICRAVGQLSGCHVRA